MTDRGAGVARPFLPDIYLGAFPDVADAVGSGAHESALSHFLDCGHAEGRLALPHYVEAFAGYEGGADDVEVHIETVIADGAGHILLAGWAADGDSPFDRAEVLDRIGRSLGRLRVVRHRREDVERARHPAERWRFGFYAAGVLAAPHDDGLWVRLLGRGGRRSTMAFAPARVRTAEAFRDTIFYYLAADDGLGQSAVGLAEALSAGVGGVLVAVNARMSRDALPKSVSHCFNERPDRPRVSFIVCLYGKIEFLFVQAALFSRAGCDGFEFVYVLNSPDLAESLLNEARIAAFVYGLRITVVIMPLNVGFGAATNAGVAHAGADQVIVLNPDVFPRHDDWWTGYLRLVERLPKAETAFFGVPLLYDDGSVMHIGMSFRVDQGILVDPAAPAPVTRRMLRVEHDGKGMAFADRWLASREVEAITGAFMAIDRRLYQRLGGFDEGFVFGHYEDADLCLRARRAGASVFVHHLPFWHLEGKGSTRLPIHATTAAVNRWYFTERWLGELDRGQGARRGSA